MKGQLTGRHGFAKLGAKEDHTSRHWSKVAERPIPARILWRFDACQSQPCLTGRCLRKQASSVAAPYPNAGMEPLAGLPDGRPCSVSALQTLHDSAASNSRSCARPDRRSNGIGPVSGKSAPVK